MTILSNLYFLVSLGILAVVYSLIGRTLLLRPPSSRSDQSHRHTVKMLGVIVLVFVLCWLPFHIGRTILSFSLGSAGGDMGDNMDTHGPPDNVVDSHATQYGPHRVPSGNGSLFTAREAHTERPFDAGRVAGMHIKDGHADTTPGAAFTSTPTTTEVNYNLQTNTTNDPTQTLIDPYMLYYLTQYFNLVSFVLFYLSAAVNPLLYNIMSSRYRQAVRSLVHSLVQSLVHTRAGSGSSGPVRSLSTLHSTITM
ncbi:hypothetical protein NHX12_032704 [Muraenolepis orangiensis]|uniref:G-protein coupled receptors family 1 profile domain-containing protein n=1 Tax=Muraenolepis orangiensis TaxID=630683 RepID=A0A9Q0IIK2_9TELE|nr:hypothetical protein NHX12_032704 [Muraenolepis orangiensis]